MEPFFVNFAYPYIYVMSIVAFIVIAYDKHLAHYGLRRVPDAVLAVLTVAMGAFGTLCGMIIFDNRTDSKLFKIGVPAVLAVQLAIVVFMIMR